MRNLPPLLQGPRLKRSALLVGNGLAQGAMTGLLTFVIHTTLSHLSGAGVSGAPRMPLTGLIVAALAFPLTLGWLRQRERVDAEWIGQHYVHALRVGLFGRMTVLLPRRLQRRSRGAIMLRFVGDLTALRSWVSLGIARLIVAVLSAVVSILALALIDPAFAGIMVLILFFGAGATALAGRHLMGTVREARRQQSRLAANVNEKIAAMPLVQAFGQSGRERKRLARQSERLRHALVARARSFGALQGLAEGIAVFAGLAVLVAGAIGISEGRTLPSTVLAGLFVINLLAPRLREVGRVYEYWAGAQVSREKIRDFLNEPSLASERPDAVTLQVRQGRITFEDVCYDDALDRISATAEPGARIAIVGPNGSGKTTLVSMTVRLLDPDSGRIIIDGQNLADCKTVSVRNAIGYVSPDMPLLRGSIRMNLRYRWPAAPDEEIARVIALSGLEDTIAGLPAGLDSRITENGANLSLGQRQRITLARALVGAPKILILDETESHLDPQAALALDRVIDDFEGTVLAVTHRLDRLLKSDQVWHLDAGRLIESGPPDGILRDGAATAALFGTGKALAS